jgi:hypothetical protein
MVPVKIMESHNKWFMSFPFNKRLKDEVKMMEGADWHGRDDAPHLDLIQSVFGTTKIWSVKQSIRNAFQLDYLMGNDPYARWDIPPASVDLPDTRFHKKRGECRVYDHQKLLVRTTLARHYAFWAAEMRSGKSLAAIFVMEIVGGDWWFVAPKSALASVRDELYNWGCKNMPRLMTYDDLKKVMMNWTPGEKAPFGVFFDESHFLKNPGSQRSQAARALADGIRSDHGQTQYWKIGPKDPYIIPMTGSPAPKGPDDFWNQCEIVAPGFIREGKLNAFRSGLGLFAQEESAAGWVYNKKIAWLDDENKCAQCGQLVTDHFDTDHPWQKSVNEVDRLYKRMDGLTTVLFTRDCIDIAPRIHRVLNLDPLPSTLRAARLITKSCARSAEAQILLRELSDGFQYREENGKRITLDAHSPKEEALQDILHSHSEDGRLVVYAGFQGSIDKCIKVATGMDWHIVSWDGRGVKLLSPQGLTMLSGPDDIIRAFNDTDLWPRVCFIGQADSAGTGLNLSVADEIVYYSNSFKSDSRLQSEARCDAPDKRGVMITDLCHLPTDELVLANLREKRDTQAIAMGDLIRVLEERATDG